MNYITVCQDGRIFIEGTQEELKKYKAALAKVMGLPLEEKINKLVVGSGQETSHDCYHISSKDNYILLRAAPGKLASFSFVQEKYFEARKIYETQP